jgi:hypothetical protein
MNNIAQEGSIVALVIALTSVAGLYIQSKFLPLVSLVIGVGITFGVIGVSVETFISGLIFGLIASGSWDSGKAIVKLAE